MNKQFLAIGMTVLLLTVGLSGCNEIINDDDKFYAKAEAIVDNLYPITTSNLYSKGYKASNYRLEIADYTLSSGAEEIRDSLDFALEHLDWYCDYALGSYPSAKTIDTGIEMINTLLDGVTARISRRKN